VPASKGKEKISIYLVHVVADGFCLVEDGAHVLRLLRQFSAVGKARVEKTRETRRIRDCGRKKISAERCHPTPKEKNEGAVRSCFHV
jgi:hypothetical protein